MDVLDGAVEIGQAARQLGLTVEAVRKRIHRGTLRAHKVDDRWFVVLPAPDDAGRTSRDTGQDDKRSGLHPVQPVVPDAVMDDVQDTVRLDDRGQDVRDGVVRVLAQQLDEARGMAERLHRENVELAGRVGFLQAEVLQLKDQVRMLAAPAPAIETTNHPAGQQNGQDSGAQRVEEGAKRPWWAFWRPVTA